MKESVAVAKEADAKKGFLATKNDKSIHRLRDEPERQLGSLRGVIGHIRRNGGKPSVESIATQLSGMHSIQRAPALLALQQTHGNRYVQRVVSRIQAKLKVGQPGDVYEQEADRVAEEVMRMPEPQVQRQFELEDGETLETKPLANQITPLVQVQRQKEPEEEVETLQAKPLTEQITPLVQRLVEEEEEEFLQAKELSGQTSEISPNLEARINAIRGGGQPLPASTRTFFEPRFGYDFSQVRVHTTAQCDMLNHALNARAFTTGKDIYFRQGEYNPGISAGRQLLAHELTHVLQQNRDEIKTKKDSRNLLSSNAVKKPIFRKLTLGSSGDIYEQGADQLAHVFATWEQSGARSAEKAGSTERQAAEEGTEEEKSNTMVMRKWNDGYLFRQVEEEPENEEELLQTMAQEGEVKRQQHQSITTHTAKVIRRSNGGEEETTTTAETPAPEAEETTPPTPAEGRAPTSTPPSTQPAQTYSVSWRMGYHEVFVTTRGRGSGGERAPRGTHRARAGEDVLIVNSLRMVPEGGGDVVVFSGSNPLVSGSAVIGPQNHPADVGGSVSGQVYYTNMDRMVVDASVRDGVRVDEATIERLMGARVPEALRTARSEAEVEAILLTAGQRELSERAGTSGGRNPATLDSIDVTFSQSGVDHILPAIHYGIIDRDKIIDGMIVISSDRAESTVVTQVSGRRGAMIRGRRGLTIAIEETRVEVVRQTVTNSVARGVEAAVQSAVTTGFTRTDRERTRWQAAGTGQLTGRAQIDIGAEAPIGLGTLLRGLGLIGELGAQITSLAGLDINLDLRLGVQGETSGTIGAELSYENEQIHEMVRQRTDRIVEDACAHIRWRSVIATAVTSSMSQTGRVSETREVTGEETRGAGRSTTRTDTRVRYLNPRPQLRISGQGGGGTTGGNP